MTSKNTGKSTCSPASAASASDSEWQAGLTIDLFSQADSPASPGVSPGSSEAQKMTVTSGQKWQDLLKVCGLDGCLAKTFRGLLEHRWASTECFLTWNVSPQEHDKVNGDPKRVGRYGTKHGGRNLNDEMAAEYEAAKMWATPAERDHRYPNAKPYSERGGGKKGEQLPNQAAHSGQTTPPSEGGALNPEFVCWLMGYPSEWLNCAPSAMPSSRKSSRKSPAQ